VNTSATYSSLNDLSEGEGVKGRETINKAKIVVAVEVAGGTRKKQVEFAFDMFMIFLQKAWFLSLQKM